MLNVVGNSGSGIWERNQERSFRFKLWWSGKSDFPGVGGADFHTANTPNMVSFRLPNRFAKFLITYCLAFPPAGACRLPCVTRSESPAEPEQETERSCLTLHGVLLPRIHWVSCCCESPLLSASPRFLAFSAVKRKTSPPYVYFLKDGPRALWFTHPPVALTWLLYPLVDFTEVALSREGILDLGGAQADSTPSLVHLLALGSPRLRLHFSPCWIGRNTSDSSSSPPSHPIPCPGHTSVFASNAGIDGS